MKITKARNRTIVHETPEKSRIETHHFVTEDLRKAIEKKAYELYEGRGCVPGRDIEDWLEAEKMFSSKKES